MSNYIKGLIHGVGSLLTGLKVTGREFFTPKVTEQYPETGLRCACSTATAAS